MSNAEFEPTAVQAEVSRGPNFLIAGAPKSGTTAMANYLREHPHAFMTDVKEPFFFATDLPAMARSTGFSENTAYASLFATAKKHHRARGEGSTLYLYSREAIPNALAYNPAMKFIFMLRRPSEIAQAYHMQMRIHEFEDLPEFEAAWQQNHARRLGRVAVPPRCKEPQLLLYDEVAAIGSQLERAFDLIPKSQRFVLLFDDFVSDSGESYRSVLDFLGLPDDGRQTFEKENAARVPRLAWLSRGLRSPAVVSFSRFLKRHLAGHAFAAARQAKHALMFRRSPRINLRPEFDQELHTFFQPEVARLESLLNRELSVWKTPKNPRTSRVS